MKIELEFDGSVNPRDAAAAARAIAVRLWGLGLAVAVFFLIVGFLFGAGYMWCPS